MKNKLIWLIIPPFSQSDVWIFQETFLKPKDHFQISGKVIFRKDRIDRPGGGGGLLIAVPANISARQISFHNTQLSEYEILILQIVINNTSFHLINLYASRGLNITLLNSFLESLSDPVFNFDDFNLHPMWGSNHTSPYSEIFVEWLTNSNFILLNTDVPTHRSNVGSGALLDFTLCSSNLIGYSNTFVSDSSYNSDHCPVITDFNFHNPIKRTINKVDWRSLTEQIQAELFAENFASNNINHEPLPLDYFAQDNSLINNHFHTSELNRAIKSAKNTTSGADQIPAKYQTTEP
ncbi:hypothetical protein TNCV_3149771 [Trichonephila clavipes]|nr:hypothetical protein TNCV_3149771 [Trichonephila clavipes]